MADRRLGWLHGDRDRQFAVGTALVGAPRGRHVGIVATDRGADVALAGQNVVGGIQADPAEAGQVGLEPGMGGVVGRAVQPAAAVIEIARDVARRDAPGPRDRDHDVGEVLADAAPPLQRHLDRRGGVGDAGLVFEGIVDRGAEMLERGQGIGRGLLQAVR